VGLRFVHDACQDGRKLKILTVEDEFTRRCLAIEVERRMPASAVCQTLLRLLADHGTPQFVRSDNGPEFIARAPLRPTGRCDATRGLLAPLDHGGIHNQVMPRLAINEVGTALPPHRQRTPPGRIGGTCKHQGALDS
jgi:transposase InsO family protein